MRYGFEWTPGIFVLGLVVVLPLAPGFAMIGLFVVAVAALAALVALVGALLATPYLLVRTVRRRLAERDRSTEGSGAHALPAAKSVVAT
jgi:membrane associated rhomboid family serine protease